jgi:hypothetical protein
LHRHSLANLFWLEVQILSRLLGNPRKNGSGYDATVIGFGGGLGVIQDDQTYELRPIGGEIT